MAGAIAELAKKALARDFRTIDPAKARIILAIEAGPRVLPSFDPFLATTAQRGLEKLGLEVRLGGAVTACDELGVALGGERIEARTIIWAGGFTASPAGEWLNVETDRSGRVVVSPDLAVPSHRDIFVLNDTACVDTGPYARPAAARHCACRQGAGRLYCGAHRRRIGQQGVAAVSLQGSRLPGHHRPEERGRPDGAVAAYRLHRLAHLISGAHLFFWIGFRSRLSVVLNWAWNDLTFQRGTRLITGLTGSRVEDLAEPPRLRQFIWPPTSASAAPLRGVRGP